MSTPMPTLAPIDREEGPIVRRAVPGPALYFLSRMPAGRPKAIVGLVPGYGDHAARYEHLMEAWAERGIGVVAIDTRGHGRAGGRRGFCQRFDEYGDDVAELQRLVSDRAKGAPKFLMGHSFGALIAAYSLLDKPGDWRGLVMSSPFISRAVKVPAAKIFVGRIASRVVPKLALPSGLTGAMMTHDPERARAYDADPLIFETVTARWFTETEKAQATLLARASSITLPIYTVVGTADPVANVAGGRALFDRVGSKDKTWDERSGFLHEPFSEVEWRAVAGSIGDWIEAHAG